MSPHTSDADAVLAERARDLARPADPGKPHGVEPMVTFDDEGETYALPLPAVREILTISSLTRLPARLAPVTGLTAVRGRIAAVVDLGGLLGRARPGPPARASWGIALAGTSPPVVLPIQHVEGIEDVDASGLHATAHRTSGGTHPVRGVTAAGVAVLDAAALRAAIDGVMRRDQDHEERGAS